LFLESVLIHLQAELYPMPVPASAGMANVGWGSVDQHQRHVNVTKPGDKSHPEQEVMILTVAEIGIEHSNPADQISFGDHRLHPNGMGARHEGYGI
jgi:hypothetical protein